MKWKKYKASMHIMYALVEDERYHISKSVSNFNGKEIWITYKPEHGDLESGIKSFRTLTEAKKYLENEWRQREL